MKTPKARPELICISCSGGGRDANGAYTVCALCLLAASQLPDAA